MRRNYDLADLVAIAWADGELRVIKLLRCIANNVLSDRERADCLHVGRVTWVS